MKSKSESPLAGKTRRAVGGVGLALGLAALACGAESDPVRHGGASGTTGETSGVGGATGGVRGDAGVGGVHLDGTGGTNVEQPPASAPACGTEALSRGRIELAGEGRVFGAPYFVRVLEQGFGLPPGASDQAAGDASADDGWLRLAVVDADAGAAAPDAAAFDASANAGSPQQILAGRQVGELPVIVGEVLQLTYSFDSSIALFLRHFRIVLERGDDVILFHQDTNMYLFGTFEGFTLARGDAVCATPYPNVERRCADIYSHALEVTVPGGATATLPPGQARAVGSYRVLNADTSSVTRIPTSPGNSSCADIGMGAMSFTALLQAEAP